MQTGPGPPPGQNPGLTPGPWPSGTVWHWARLAVVGTGYPVGTLPASVAGGAMPPSSLDTAPSPATLASPGPGSKQTPFRQMAVPLDWQSASVTQSCTWAPVHAVTQTGVAVALAARQHDEGGPHRVAPQGTPVAPGSPPEASPPPDPPSTDPPPEELLLPPELLLADTPPDEPPVPPELLPPELPPTVAPLEEPLPPPELPPTDASPPGSPMSPPPPFEPVGLLHATSTPDPSKACSTIALIFMGADFSAGRGAGHDGATDAPGESTHRRARKQ